MITLYREREGTRAYLGPFPDLDAARAYVEQQEAAGTWPEGWDALAFVYGTSRHDSRWLFLADDWEDI